MADQKISAFATATTYDTDDFLAGVDTSATTSKKFSRAVVLAGLLGSTSGLLKANGSGVLSAALAGTDYLAPSGSGAALTGITAVQVGAEPTITAGTTAQYLRGDKSLATLNQAAVAGLTTASSPVFTGLTVGTLTGLLKATSGVVSAATAGTDYLITSYAGTSSIVTVGTITSGTWTGTTIAVANGGTGQTSASAAINALVPTQTGNSGKVLGTNGSAVSWVTASGTGTVSDASVVSANGFAGTVATSTTTPAITLTTTVTGMLKGNGTAISAGTLGIDYSKLLVPTAVKTAGYTAAVWDFVPCDTTAGGFTVTLPTAPTDRSLIGVKHVQQGSTNVVTVATGGSDVINRTGGVTTLSLSSLGRGVQLQYQSSTGIWFVINRDVGSILAADVPAPGSTTQVLYNNAGALAGSANIAVGSSGQLALNPIADPGSPVAGNLWFDTAWKSLSILQSGVIARVGGIIWQATSAATAVANTTSATSLLAGGTTFGSLTFPANSLTVGKIIRPMLFGTWGATGTPTITFSLTLGGVAIGTGSGAQTAQVGKFWSMENVIGPAGWQVQTIGAAGKIIGGARLNCTSGAGVTLNASGTTLAAPTQATIDTTTSLTLDLTAQWSAASASNTIQLLGGWIEILG